MNPGPDDALTLRCLAESIARDTGVWLIAERQRGVGSTSTKSTATDVVTWFDQEAERRIVTRLGQCRPHDAIVGEEGSSVEGTSGVHWLIDPIDGTTNFVYDLGGYAVSIAACDANGPVAGAVYIPSTGELFSAHRGGGATRDGYPLSPSATTDFAQALVGTGFSYVAQRRAHQAQRIADLLPKVRDIRRLGAAAVDLCWVACGRLDVYFEQHLNPWDTAAGVLVATEAGCHAGDFRGGPARADEVVVTTPALFAPMLEWLHATAAPTP
jgi:myo-inositol-1(or 4)-monophosphatase